MDYSLKATPQLDSVFHADDEHPLLDHISSVFRPVNPWKMTLQQCLTARNSMDPIRTIDDIQPNIPMYYPTRREESEVGHFSSEKKPGSGGRVTFGWPSTILTFLLDWLPRQVYIKLLFYIPNIYMSRIEKIFDDAGESLVDLKRRAQDESSGIKQPDVKTFELRLIPVPIGRNFTFDLVSVVLFMMIPAFSCAHWWIDRDLWAYLNAQEPVFTSLVILMYLSYAAAACASIYSPQVTQRDGGATWNYNVAMNTRGIHQPFHWNICVHLAMKSVWTIWGYTFSGFYFLLAYLKQCHPPIYAKIPSYPFMEVFGYMIAGYVYLFGAITIILSWYYGRQYKKWESCP